VLNDGVASDVIDSRFDGGIDALNDRVGIDLLGRDCDDFEACQEASSRCGSCHNPFTSVHHAEALPLPSLPE
jgi:hypothetical protein